MTRFLLCFLDKSCDYIFDIKKKYQSFFLRKYQKNYSILKI